jgi:hypothetical protein
MTSHSNAMETSVCDYLAGLVADSINEKLFFKDEVNMPVITGRDEDILIIERSYEGHNTALHITLNQLSRGFIGVKCLHYYCCRRCMLTTKIDVKDLSDHEKIVKHIGNYVRHLTRKRAECKVHGTPFEVTP